MPNDITQLPLPEAIPGAVIPDGHIPDGRIPAGRLPAGTWIVAGLFTVSGVVHLVRPAVFEPLMPDALGDPAPWIVGSGVAELACVAGLVGRTRWAPTAAAATLLVIWVGNVQHAVRIQRSSRTSRMQKAIGWARLPLQVPLIRWALASPVRSD